MRIGARIREDAIGAWHVAEDVPEPGTLRVLREDLVGQEPARLLFLEELRRIRSLDHPGLLRVHAHDAAGKRPWMLTEPVDGPTLATVLASGGPWREADALAFARGVAEALAYLAERDQVHVLPVPERFVRVGPAWKLLTFRDVRAGDELRGLKGRRHPAPAFAPPERAREHPADCRLDGHNAWAVGALLRFVAGGALPATRRLLDPDPRRRPHGAAAILRVLAGEDPGEDPGTTPKAAPRPAAPVPTRRRGGGLRRRGRRG